MLFLHKHICIRDMIIVHAEYGMRKDYKWKHAEVGSWRSLVRRVMVGRRFIHVHAKELKEHKVWTRPHGGKTRYCSFSSAIRSSSLTLIHNFWIFSYILPFFPTALSLFSHARYLPQFTILIYCKSYVYCDNLPFQTLQHIH